MINRHKNIFFLHFIIAIYSLSSVFSKIAGSFPFLSLNFCLCYSIIVVVLGVYAIGWQQIIKHMPLTAAFANKAVTVVWGMIYGMFFFQEEITLGKLLGITMIVFGVVIFTGTEREKEHVE